MVITRSWHGRLTLKRLHEQARRYGLVASADAVFPPELRPFTVSWPRLVGMEADLSGGLEGCRRALNNSAMGDMRRLRREGFTMQVGAAHPIFDDFYHRYYLPSMRKRHGNDAYLHELESERAKLSPNDVILEVHSVEGCVARVVIAEEDDGIRLSRLGWLDGREDIYRKSVLGALYWFSLTYATAQGYPRLNFGSVTPYLEDGLFIYKEKWLGRLSWRKSFHDEWQVMADPDHVVTRRFFDRNSLVIKNGATQRFDVISNRNRDDVFSASVESPYLGEWHQPHQVWRSLAN